MMTTIIKQKFNNEVITVDETHFEECVFDNCLLLFSGKNYSFFNCSTIGGSKCRLIGSARRTAMLILAWDLPIREMYGTKTDDDKTDLININPSDFTVH